MDTWATSSLTPQIAGGWEDDPDLFAPGLPHGPAPAGPRDHPHLAVLDGGALASSSTAPCRGATPPSPGGSSTPTARRCPSRKGNVVTPLPLLEKYGADAVRYWAAAARPGTDTAFDEAQMKIGRRLAIKILNASQFVLVAPGGRGPVRRCPTRLIAPLDAAMLAPPRRRGRPRPRPRSRPSTTPGPSRSPRRSSGRSATTTSSWSRPAPTARRPQAGPRLGPARPGRWACRCCCACFAPFLPFVTEEVWSWWQPGSVHTPPWPSASGTGVAGRPRARPELADAVAEVLVALRRAKTEAKGSMRTQVARCLVTGPAVARGAGEARLG